MVRFIISQNISITHPFRGICTDVMSTHIKALQGHILGWGDKKDLEDAMTIETCKAAVKKFEKNGWNADVRYKGDDSTPLTYKKGNQHILMGFISHKKINCAKPEWTDVYGDFGSKRYWIDRNMKDPIYCNSGPNVKK